MADSSMVDDEPVSPQRPETYARPPQRPLQTWTRLLELAQRSGRAPLTSALAPEQPVSPPLAEPEAHSRPTQRPRHTGTRSLQQRASRTGGAPRTPAQFFKELLQTQVSTYLDLTAQYERTLETENTLPGQAPSDCSYLLRARLVEQDVEKLLSLPIPAGVENHFSFYDLVGRFAMRKYKVDRRELGLAPGQALPVVRGACAEQLPPRATRSRPQKRAREDEY